MFKWIEDNI